MKNAFPQHSDVVYVSIVKLLECSHSDCNASDYIYPQ